MPTQHGQNRKATSRQQPATSNGQHEATAGSNMAEQRPESTAIGMNIPWPAHHFSQTVQLIKSAHNCGFNNIIDRGT